MYPNSIYSDYFNWNGQQKLSDEDAILLTKSIRNSDYAKIDDLISKFGKQILQQTFACSTGKRTDKYIKTHTVFEYIDPNNLTNFKEMLNYLIGKGVDINMPKLPDLSGSFCNPDTQLRFDNYIDSIRISDFKYPIDHPKLPLYKIGQPQPYAYTTGRPQLCSYQEMVSLLTGMGARSGFTSSVYIVKFLVYKISSIRYSYFGEFILPCKDKVTSALPLHDGMNAMLLKIKEIKFEFFKAFKSEESSLHKLPQKVIAKILNALECSQIDTRKVFQNKFKVKFVEMTEREVLFLAALQDPASEVSRLPHELVLEVLRNRIRM